MDQDARQEGFPSRPLGRTGERVSLLGLGGFHLGTLSDAGEAERVIRTAIDRGLTFMDNCWDYHEGRSEQWMGRALEDGYRERAFLMSKVDGRTRAAAARQIDESLKRLRTDRIDLMQHHELIRFEDPDRIFEPGGAMEAFLEAQRAGKLRYIGFTGHKDPLIHLRTLEVAAEHGFRFDAVQLPLNALDAHFRSFERQVLPKLLAQEIGVLGMKPLAAGKLPAKGGLSAVEALHYAMNLPVSVVITGVDSFARLEQALEAAESFAPLSDDEVAALLARTAAPALGGRLERFKTGTDHDGTAQRPEWLG